MAGEMRKIDKICGTVRTLFALNKKYISDSYHTYV